MPDPWSFPVDPATPRRRPDAMILPPADPASGEVDAGPWHSRDARVPMPFARDGFEPRLLAYWQRDEHCPRGRHLWDALVVHSAEAVPFLADDDVERVRFRMRLTCVRCGLVHDVHGIREDDGRPRTERVDPVPIRSGRLLAQQVEGGGRGDLSSWAVHDNPAAPAVGFMTWARGPRGRRYFSGRLHAWPDGVSVQGPTPSLCLARLAAAPAGGPVAPTATAVTTVAAARPSSRVGVSAPLHRPRR